MKNNKELNHKVEEAMNMLEAMGENYKLFSHLEFNNEILSSDKKEFDKKEFDKKEFNNMVKTEAFWLTNILRHYGKPEQMQNLTMSLAQRCGLSLTASFDIILKKIEKRKNHNKWWSRYYEHKYFKNQEETFKISYLIWEYLKIECEVLYGKIKEIKEEINFNFGGKK